MADIQLNKDIFEVEVKSHALLKKAYDAYLANSRMAHAKTLTRGLVRGGGKKPWRQKGTGRARFGSIRNPIWRGGGIAFGPNGQQNYTIRLSKQEKRVALTQALTLAHKDNLIKVLEYKTTGKTKEMADFLAKNKLKGRVLLVAGEKTPELIRATRNLDNTKLVSAMYLTVFDILNADAIVIDKAGLDKINTWLGLSEEA
ncbi:MAG: 50S ribosomal protein L4 [Candidatus Saccharibacteria bacterium]|nr:50S ribosomal protein L4 [Candidatus Saccharibacteria bacterium]